MLARPLRMILAVFALLGAGGCSKSGQVTGGDSSTAAAAQSETGGTSSFVGGVNRLVVAFNDDTNDDGKVLFADSSSRKVLAGASQMGWSYSDNNGVNWTYGGKLATPKGWSVLWGDPAMTTSRALYSIVFMSNLAVPDSKFPSGGIDGPFYSGSDIRSSPLGGACIAKSTDGGKTFAIYQCVSNQDPIADLPEAVHGHFYDGGSMASSPTGEIFAGFIDVATSQIDVWRAADANQPFKRLPGPFPKLVSGSHPRLRVANDGTLYAGAEVVSSYADYRVFLNRYQNGSWGTPTQASDSTVLYPGVDLNSTVLGSELTLRTGPQFGFDVGAASAGGLDGIRILYTRNSGSRLYVGGAVCASDLSSCSTATGNWGTVAPGPNDQPFDSFNPDVVAWPGFIGIPPIWQGTFVTRYGKSTTSINVARETLGYLPDGTPFTIPVDIVKNAPVCSDTRGYWGDYDDMLLVGFKSDGNGGSTGTWMRFVTDSSAGCSKRWTFTAAQQHVLAVQYDY
jgi:hypothetical protein